MIRYIPLNQFNNALEGNLEEILSSGDQNAIEGLYEKLRDSYSEKDIQLALSQMKKEGAVVFHGWIAQHKVLENFITKGEIGRLELTETVKNHILFPQFQKFVSSYLQEQLLYTQPKNDSERASLFSLVCLLTDDVRPVVETKLIDPIHRRAESLLEVKATISDVDLNNTLSKILSEQVIYSLNSLSRAMYHEKVFFTERLLNLIRSSICTPQVSNWILKQLDQLRLNKEHKDKLHDIRSDLKSGKIKGLKTINAKGHIIAPFKLLGVILSLAVLIILFFFFFENSKKETIKTSSYSSFKTFTNEERVQMDSIIKILQAKHDKDYYNVDTTVNGQLVIPTYLLMRRSFQNDLMERIYLDWNKDGILQDLYLTTPVSEKCQISRRKGEKPLSTKNGEIRVQLANESAYSLVIYAGKNNPRAFAYSQYIPQDTTIEFLLDKDDVFFCVAGRSFQKFEVPSNVVPDLLPDFEFKEHFGSTDNNYIESINNPYFVKQSATAIQILVTGNNNNHFAIIELDGVLEAY